VFVSKLLNEKEICKVESLQFISNTLYFFEDHRNCSYVVIFYLPLFYVVMLLTYMYINKRDTIEIKTWG
jgi:hypothetical protein